MNLLFQRSQSKSGQGMPAMGGNIPVPSVPFGKPSFKLWAKVELDREEQAISDHYHFDKYLLVDSFQPDLLRYTAYVFGAVFVFAFFFFWGMMSFQAGIWLGIISAGVSAYLYWDRHRESIMVSDLLAGRYFSCKSIVDLARKEALIEMVSQFLRQVMESARHWDGTETIKVEPLPKDEAKRVIIKGL